MKSKFQLVYRVLTRKELGLPTSESMQDAIHSWIELDSIAIWIIYICDRLSILSQYRPNRRQCRVRMGQRRLTITAMHDAKALHDDRSQQRSKTLVTRPTDAPTAAADLNSLSFNHDYSCEIVVLSEN